MENGKYVHFRAGEGLVEFIKQYAKKNKTSVSEAIRTMIAYHQMMDQVGFKPGKQVWSKK